VGLSVIYDPTFYLEFCSVTKLALGNIMMLLINASVESESKISGSFTTKVSFMASLTLSNGSENEGA